jgi:hypothetical protein
MPDALRVLRMRAYYIGTGNINCILYWILDFVVY